LSASLLASAEAAKANKEADKQQRKETRGQDPSKGKGQPKARGEQVGNPSKPEFKGPPAQVSKPDTKEHKHESAQPGGGKGKGKGKP